MCAFIYGLPTRLFLAPPQRKASTASMPPTTPTASNNGARTAKGDGVSTSITGDKTRDKCIEMLYDALALESGFRTCCHLGSPLRHYAYIIRSIRSHTATRAHGRRDGVQRLQGNHCGLQVKDSNAICEPQRQEQPRLAQERYSRRYTRPDVCKNDQPGLSHLSNRRRDRLTCLSGNGFGGTQGSRRKD